MEVFFFFCEKQGTGDLFFVQKNKHFMKLFLLDGYDCFQKKEKRSEGELFFSPKNIEVTR